MRIKRIAEEAWTLYGVMEGQHDVLQDMASLRRQYRAHVDGLLNLMEDIASGRRDPTQLPADLCHRIDDNYQIWQFTKGRLRLLWFYDGVRLIICAHVFLKRTPTTPARERNIAIDLKGRYERAKLSGTLEIIQDEDE
ncbi:hypothetical protein HF668_01735 [Acidithiobacillus ferridurans]|uniref:type II toxin-antitoxin system RelE/ParE family toxin n=1 Tax=Acidithiobacillus ferridurans TaxID=1232575 RepID=UPI001C072259|nr:type II toxin-antitoxin system RelE/ParE family toxin [Acidithiobacillus ferridurans]MBU2803904.1 hypothetical protein [Acidithiobacillus ferridurans]